MKEKKYPENNEISYNDVNLSESLDKLDDEEVLNSITEEREKLNCLVKEAIINEEKLNTNTIKEQKKIVEMYIDEALLRKLEDNIDDENG